MYNDYKLCFSTGGTRRYGSEHSGGTGAVHSMHLGHSTSAVTHKVCVSKYNTSASKLVFTIIFIPVFGVYMEYRNACDVCM